MKSRVPRDMTSRWEASPFDLAIFRVVVCALVLAFTDVAQTVALARLPEGLRVAEPSLAFPLASIPVGATAARVAGYALHAGCALALVGWLTRPALVVATLAGLYFLGISQHVGAVVHHHHLLWFLAVLSASPSADVLSIDAVRRAARGAARPAKRALVYGVPVWTARLLIGLVFFFPGAWKLAESGWAWILSDNLRNQMYWKWFQHDALALRVDRYPAILRGMAGAAVAFELTVIPLLLWRRSRALVAAWAFLFHMATELLMFIRFTSLWPSYVVILDAHRTVRGLAAEVFPRKLVVSAPPRTVAVLRATDLLGRVIYRPSDICDIDWPRLCLRHPLAPLSLWAAALEGGARPARRAPSLWPSLAAAALLLTGNTLAGVTGRTQAWPFACYPTFQWLAGEHIPHLAVDAVRGDGTIVAIDVRPRSQKEWGVVWSVAGATHGAFDRERLLAFWASAERARREAARAGAVRLRFYRAYSSVIPEEAGAPPVSRELLYETPL